MDLVKTLVDLQENERGVAGRGGGQRRETHGGHIVADVERHAGVRRGLSGDPG